MFVVISVDVSIGLQAVAKAAGLEGIGENYTKALDVSR